MTRFLFMWAGMLVAASIAIDRVEKKTIDHEHDVRRSLRLGYTTQALAILWRGIVAVLLLMVANSMFGVFEMPWSAQSIVFGFIMASFFMLAFTAVLCPALGAWLPLRRIVAHVRLPRVAYVASMATMWGSLVPWTHEHGLLAGALALMKNGSPEEIAAWRKRIAALDTITLPALVAEGLLAARCGEHDRARAILGGVMRVAPSTRHSFVRVLAAEWIVADAASRGAWAEIAALPRIGCSPFMFADWAWVRLCQDVAAEIAGTTRRVPSRQFFLYACGSLRPGGVRSLAAQRKMSDDAALRALDEPALGGVVSEGDMHGRALAAHARLIAAGATSPAHLGDAIEAWSEALASPEVRAAVLTRAAVLDGRPDEAWQRFESEVRSDLRAAAAGVEGLDAVSLRGALGEELMAEAKSRMLDQLEDEAATLAERTRTRRFVPNVDEWIELSRIRMHHDRLLAAGARPEEAYNAVRPGMWAHAVWLHNDFAEVDIAYVSYGFLHEHASRIGNAEHAKLLKGNAISAS